MRRMGIGTVAGVAIWIASAVAAEAQGITPNGPTAVYTGATAATYTAAVYLPSPNSYLVRLWVYRGATQLHYTQTGQPNPGVVNSTFSKDAGFSTSVAKDDVLVFKVAMKINGVWIPANYPINGETINLSVTVTNPPSRPSSKAVTKATSIQKGPSLALQSIDRERRRE